ncbi:MAG: 6-carboxytetrahydropterin synthase QueD [Endomicrobia bacterium]|nr:6-carboxytetrahydropterin synthase QueD [Endomicrobiia bacterium]MCX7941021.1 6-carboxytetrahydropterin synthase QueD [Endomicrobiia bacterium]MDW8055407.1 6-carboxytetrahydropterin synthase QueD [Elusimicrobiota bacterium]
MYEIYVETNFSAAHWLKNYRGKCEKLHGHNWKVGVSVWRSGLNSQDMVIDFVELKNILNKVISKLDHKCINSLPYFRKKQTTAENIAQFIHLNLTKLLQKYKLEKIKVIVWETPIQYASYER